MEKHCDPGMIAGGMEKITWAAQHMPVLAAIGENFEREKPLAGMDLSISIHLEAKTAWFALMMAKGGARVSISGSNPLSVQDDVCAALASQGVTVNARYGCSDDEYRNDLLKTLSVRPQLLLDDGGDLVSILTYEHPELSQRLIGGCEETTTGVLRLKAMAAAGELPFPMMLVNDADMKHLFDNRYGCGQSVWDGILRTTNVLIAGKTVVVAGYGWCGKGVAMRAKGLGAKVIVTEVDPVCAVEAVMDGFEVFPMEEAARRGDIFVTVTGCCDVIDERHFPLLKDGAILCNAGHFDVEVAMDRLRETAVSHKQARKNIETYQMPWGKTICVLAQGRLVNLAAADGHPAEIMDMSFSVQALTLRYLALEGRKLKAGVYPVPGEIDGEIARLKLSTLGVRIDEWTPKQRKYLFGR